MKYNKDELWQKETVSTFQAAYLLGGIPVQNIYRMVDTGKLEVVKEPSLEARGRITARVTTKSLLNYMIKRREELVNRFSRFKFPSDMQE